MELFGLKYLCSSCLLILFCLERQLEGQPEEKYVIDTLVVMDAPAYNTWVNRQPIHLTTSQRQQRAREKIKEYISLVIRQANVRLESLTDDANKWTVELSVAAFAIGSDPLASQASQATQSIAYEAALTSLQLWGVATGYKDMYDYLILFTGYNLLGAASLPYEIKGIAKIGRLCHTDGTSMSIVEDRGGFQSVHFVAHEFGHSLGSTHDGESPNTACPADDRYLMAINKTTVTPSNRLNPWYFSTCSKKTIGIYLVDTILQKFSSCLRDAKPAALEFTKTANVLPGQVYDVKAQCQHLYGSQSTVCLGERFKLSDVCTSMYCLDTTPGSVSFECSQHRAAEGSSCGDGKICQKGQCKESPLAPSTNFSNCFFGDASVNIEGKYTCSEYIDLRPMACYETTIQSYCCQSCKEIRKQSAACPYGDKKTGCTADLCQRIGFDGTRFEEVCCGICGYDVIKKCDDVSNIDGMTCEERVSLNNVQGCYNTSVAYQCCKTCAGLRRNVTGCEYGDKLVERTCKSFVYDEATCQKYGKQCCQTCKNLDLSTAWTPQGSFLLIAFVVLFNFISYS